MSRQTSQAPRVAGGAGAAAGGALRPLRLADYVIQGPLGAGATARVVAATHLATGQAVAIKMLEPSARGSVELEKRLEREAQLLASVKSRHVARVHGAGWEQGQPFIVLERLHGETMADLLKRDGRLDVHRLSEWMEQLLLGVRDIHAAGVIHRDIKPANIFLAEGGLKLIDFGVARLKEIAMDGASLTSTHHLIGSLGYMAPEQLEYAKGAGPPADLYAVGVVVFRCITGRLPFVGRTLDALHKMKVGSEAPRLSSFVTAADESRASLELDAFVAHALARDPVFRFASAQEMLEAWWRVASALEADTPPAMPESLITGYDLDLEDSITILEFDTGTFRSSVNAHAAPLVEEAAPAAPMERTGTPERDSGA